MANEKIKHDLKKSGMFQWELANALGVSEGTLIRFLRKEVSLESQCEILEILKQFRKSNNFEIEE